MKHTLKYFFACICLIFLFFAVQAGKVKSTVEGMIPNAVSE
jgi:hypothetical protein